MRKQILALVLAAAALATVGSPSVAGQRWGWSDIAGPRAWLTLTPPLVPVEDIRTYVGAAAPKVDIVPLTIEPSALKAPGILAASAPVLEEAMEAVRSIVAGNPLLRTNLEARGLDPADVVGISHLAGGLTLFVIDEGKSMNQDV